MKSKLNRTQKLWTLVAAGTLASFAIGLTALAQGAMRVHQGDHWSFAVPGDWQDAPSGTQAIAVTRATVQIRGFGSNVNLVREPFGGNPTQYAAANTAQLQRLAHVIGQHPVTVAGMSAVDIETAWTGGTPAYRTRQRMAVFNGFGYVLTCSTADDAALVQSVCDPIISTFRLTP